jgi:predicted acyl esterase
LFYAKYGQDLQRQFFDRFLKGIDNGWEKRPNVMLQVRHPGEKFVPRAENEWPLARTQWTKFYLHPDRELDLAPPVDSATLTYDTSSDGVSFSTEQLTEEMEITGPVAAKLFVSSDTTDADLFWCCGCSIRTARRSPSSARTIRACRSGLGWLRASHRKLDPKETKALPALSHPRRGTAAQARRAGRARHRDLADLDRGAQGLSCDADGARQGL